MKLTNEQKRWICNKAGYVYVESCLGEYCEYAGGCGVTSCFIEVSDIIGLDVLTRAVFAINRIESTKEKHVRVRIEWDEVAIFMRIGKTSYDKYLMYEDVGTEAETITTALVYIMDKEQSNA
jgi:hypothetical protein